MHGSSGVCNTGNHPNMRGHQNLYRGLKFVDRLQRRCEAFFAMRSALYRTVGISMSIKQQGCFYLRGYDSSLYPSGKTTLRRIAYNRRGASPRTMLRQKAIFSGSFAT